MFDILVDYPDSLPAVRDLAICLKHTNLHTRLVEHLRYESGQGRVMMKVKVEGIWLGQAYALYMRTLYN